MTFRGIDTDVYPGAAALADLKAQGYSWTAAYLESPSHSNASWPSFAEITASALNVVPVWVGGQVTGPGSHNVSGPAGTTEATACVAELQAKGYPVGHGVAFDTENGPPTPPNQIEHLTSWRDGVKTGGFRPMVYGSHANQAALAAIFGAENVWLFDLRAGSEQSSTGAPIVQYQQSVAITAAGQTLNVDLDVSLSEDPAGELMLGAPIPQAATPSATPSATPVDQPIPLPDPPAWTPPIPLTPSIPQLPPAFTPAPVAASSPTITSVATPARVGATVALTGVLAGATAMGQTHIADLKGLIDLSFTYLVSPLVLGVVVGLATSLARLLNINIQSAVAQRVLTAAENGASALVSKAQTAADADGTITTKNALIAGVLNYTNTAVPDAVKTAGLATPSGQAVLANLAEAKVQQALAAVPALKVTT